MSPAVESADIAASLCEDILTENYSITGAPIRIVRAFNTVYFEDLKKTVNKRGEKIGIPIASDDLQGLNAAVELARKAGLDPVVVGDLPKAKLFDFGSPVYATSASASEIREKLGLTEITEKMGIE